MARQDDAQYQTETTTTPEGVEVTKTGQRTPAKGAHVGDGRDSESADQNAADREADQFGPSNNQA